jgi:hypothetical protein
MSKNIPVANVLITAIGLQDISFICQSINTMRSSNDNNRNPLKKFHNSENLDEENANLNFDLGASISIVFVLQS